MKLLVLKRSNFKGQAFRLSVIQRFVCGRAASARRSWGFNGFAEMPLVYSRGGDIQMHRLLQSAVGLQGVHHQRSQGITLASDPGI